MPQMVMSHLPKGIHGKNVGARRKMKGRMTDNILSVYYTYVGVPKMKHVMYVRERMVYRSNVEATYDEVFNYLSETFSDSSISLHYRINNQYVPVTTTGQLHTFFQYVKNDPNMLLYVENKDYVWNLHSKNKNGQRKKKRAAVCAQSGEVVGNNSCGCGCVRNDASEMTDCTDETEEEGEDEEVDGEEAEDVNGEEADVEEVEDADGEDVDVEEVEGVNGEEVEEAGGEEVEDADGENVEDADGENVEDADGEDVDVEEVEDVEGLVENDMDDDMVESIRDQINGMIVSDYTDEEDEVEVARGGNNGEGTPHQECFANNDVFDEHHNSTESAKRIKLETQAFCAAGLNSSGASSRGSAGLMAEENDSDGQVPSVHDKANVISDTLYEKLRKIHNDFHSFDESEEQSAPPSSPTAERSKSPEELASYLKTLLKDLLENFHLKSMEGNALASLCNSIAIRVVDSYFPAEARFDEQVLEQSIEQMTCLIGGKIYEFLESTRMKHLDFEYVADQFIATVTYITGSTIEDNCRLGSYQRKRIFFASLSARTANKEEEEMPPLPTNEYLGDGVEELCEAIEGACKKMFDPKITQFLKSDGCQCAPYITWCLEKLRKYSDIFRSINKAEKKSGRRNLLNLCKVISLMNADIERFNAIQCRRHKNLETIVEDANSIYHAQPMDLSNAPLSAEHLKKNPEAQQQQQQDKNREGSSSQQGQQQTSAQRKEMSPELKAKIDAMMKPTPAHNYVYPPQPKPGAIMIPTGGLARCRCRRDCQFFLNEPAYEYMERFNEPRQASWEKTKQKRFKKN